MNKYFQRYLSYLNSMTKYPSIPTYHKLNEKGILTAERNVIFDEPVFATEKIDGTNARILLIPKDFANPQRFSLARKSKQKF